MTDRINDTLKRSVSSVVVDYTLVYEAYAEFSSEFKQKEFSLFPRHFWYNLIFGGHKNEPSTCTR